jgi:tetratricopeptide (TPR) repeat protein
MRTTLIFGCIFFLLFIGCNNIQEESIHGEVEHPRQQERQKQADEIYASYDDVKKVMKKCLLQEDYNGALEHLLEMENRYTARDTIGDIIFLMYYINLMLGKELEVSRDCEYFVEQMPSSLELVGVCLWASIFEMRMKNYHKAIEYLDKIELPDTELTDQQYDGLLYTIHITKAFAHLMLNEYEAGTKEYLMFLDVAKRLEGTTNLDHTSGFIDLMDKAIDRPDEYAIGMSDRPLPAPIPSPDDPDEIEIRVQYSPTLVSKIDGTVVATCTFGM